MTCTNSIPPTILMNLATAESILLACLQFFVMVCQVQHVYRVMQKCAVEHRAKWVELINSGHFISKIVPLLAAQIKKRARTLHCNPQNKHRLQWLHLHLHKTPTHKHDCLHFATSVPTWTISSPTKWGYLTGVPQSRQRQKSKCTVRCFCRDLVLVAILVPGVFPGSKTYAMFLQILPVYTNVFVNPKTTPRQWLNIKSNVSNFWLLLALLQWDRDIKLGQEMWFFLQSSQIVKPLCEFSSCAPRFSPRFSGKCKFQPLLVIKYEIWTDPSLRFWDRLATHRRLQVRLHAH